MASNSSSQPSTSLQFAEHSKLFKSNGINLSTKQNERRHRFLEQSKNARQSTLDDARGIKELVSEFRSYQQKKSKYYKKYKSNSKYRLGLQFSEWLREKPDDFEDNWYMVPVPKGIRCLCIASDNRTEIYSKTGNFIGKITSRLPGGHWTKHQNDLTILDCIWRKDEQTFYVLDVLSFGQLNFLNSECEFRFYWLKVKIHENQLNEICTKNEYSFKCCTYFECSDQYLCEQNLFTCSNLDGLLFYHKQAIYTQGSTPLVGWLLPIMVSEILGWANIDSECLIENRPDNYQTALEYMDYFDKELLNKKRKPVIARSNEDNNEMDDEDFDGDSIKEVMDEEEFLEKNGFRSDDIDNSM